MEQLAPYAVSEANSKGRVFSEPGPQYRSQFQRDRDRVIYCGAFRRLEYKTRVFAMPGLLSSSASWAISNTSR